MKYGIYAQYHVAEHRPNVLLLGNGILRSCAPKQSMSWEDSIRRLSDPKCSDEKYQLLACAPYTVQATAFASLDDSKRQKRYSDVFQTLVLEDDSLLRELLQLPFDVVLTTNYTYEIENIYHADYSRLKDKTPYAYCTRKDRDAKRLLHTYNRVKNSPEIWHIHGELRVPSSVILTHDEYARLIGDMTQYNKNNRNRYQYYNGDLRFYSWLDYMIMGNVYVLGQGLDFSEFDLWWLLNRKNRERANGGSVCFFSPEDFRCKQPTIRHAMSEMGFAVHDCGIKLSTAPKDYADQFKIFYQQAITEIKNMLCSI